MPEQKLDSLHTVNSHKKTKFVTTNKTTIHIKWKSLQILEVDWAGTTVSIGGQTIDKTHGASILYIDPGSDFKKEKNDEILDRHGIMLSLSLNVNPYVNTITEITFKILKT